MLLAQVYCPAVLTLLPGTCSSWEPTITQNPHLLTGKARVLHLGAVNLLKQMCFLLRKLHNCQHFQRILTKKQVPPL